MNRREEEFDASIKRSSLPQPPEIYEANIFDTFVNKPSTIQLVSWAFESSLLLTDLQEKINNGESLEYVRKCFQTHIHDRCAEAFEKLDPSISPNSENYTFDAVFAALYIAVFLSLSETTVLINETKKENNKFRETIPLLCFFLNEKHREFLLWVSAEPNESFYNAKEDMVRSFIQMLCKPKIKEEEKLLFLFECAENLNDIWLVKKLKKKILDFQPNIVDETCNCVDDVCDLQFRVFSTPMKATTDVTVDGNVYDRQRDPPGQRSVYIPPGDTAKETYRLSTYIRFPQEVPVNPRDLASAGFFYTGYKDRVKCFCCGLCIENWCLGDDVSASRWHRSDCNKMLGRECGNIAIGGIFARYNPTNSSTQPKQVSQLATESRSPFLSDAASENANAHSTNNSTTTAGFLLTQASNNGSGGNILKQTAKPVQQPIRPNTYERLQLASMASVNHEHLVRSLDLQKESDRFKSFENWSVQNRTVSPIDLSKSGFFYLGNYDRVQCFSCGGVLRNWKFGDNITAEHRNHFPHCRYLNGTDDRNVPFTDAERSALAPPQSIAIQEPPDPSESEKMQLMSMFQCLYPVNAHMRSEDSRLETFDMRWPSNRVRATTLHIASAGFFFLGERDRVKCWYCNGGLQNWDPDDEPWTEHAKWFPTCEFLLQRKGPDFVHAVVSRFPRLQRPTLRGSFDVMPRLSHGSSVAGQFRRPSPPPPIIDHKAEMRKVQERVRQEMTSHTARSAQDMGFTTSLIQKTLRKKLKQDGEMFKSVADLVDALMDPSMVDSDDESSDDETKPTSQSSATAKTPERAHETGFLIGGTSGGGASLNAAALNTPEAQHTDVPMETEFSLPEEATPSMQARIQELQEERKCKICLDRRADVVFVPCGHLCSCTVCAQSLRKCPMCRAKIEKSIRTYMS